MELRYCGACGGALESRRAPGDDRDRAVCTACGEVHYLNPKVVCGCVLSCGERLLLAQRSIAPRRGFWTIPAGFMELGESTIEAALRECREEVCARVLDPQLYGIVSLPRISQVYVIYRGAVSPGGFAVGSETTDVRLVTGSEIPWSQLAFPVVECALRRFVADARTGRYPVFEETILIRPGEPLPGARPLAASSGS